MSFASIRNEILRLSATERAMLIDILWESLVEECNKEFEAKWAAEAEARISNNEDSLAWDADGWAEIV